MATLNDFKVLMSLIAESAENGKSIEARKAMIVESVVKSGEKDETDDSVEVPDEVMEAVVEVIRQSAMSGNPVSKPDAKYIFEASKKMMEDEEPEESVTEKAENGEDEPEPESVTEEAGSGDMTEEDETETVAESIADSLMAVIRESALTGKPVSAKRAMVVEESVGVMLKSKKETGKVGDAAKKVGGAIRKHAGAAAGAVKKQGGNLAKKLGGMFGKKGGSKFKVE